MADTQPNLELNTGLSGVASTNTDHSTPMAVLADRGSDYRMVEMGRMKPYCLQLDDSDRSDGFTTPTCTCMDVRNCGKYHQDNLT